MIFDVTTIFTLVKVELKKNISEKNNIRKNYTFKLKNEAYDLKLVIKI
jgi:hypothetical protein